MADDRWMRHCENNITKTNTKNNKFKQMSHKHDTELKTLYTNINVVRDKPDAFCQARPEKRPCNGVENVSIIVHKKKFSRNKKRAEYKVSKQQFMQLRSSTSYIERNNVLKHNSVSEDQTGTHVKMMLTVKGSEIICKQSCNFLNTNVIVNAVSANNVPNLNPFQNPIAKTQWEVYRCQFNTKEESCCCCCNSDTMFEVMKSLYDCYKKKNCDNCNCILCGHLPKEERRLGEMRKSALEMVTASTKVRKKEIDKKTKAAEAAMVGKSPAEKEKILKALAMSGVPLPVGKTDSEKELIQNLKTQLGLPPVPKTAAEKEKMKKAEAAGIIIPLEGKTAAEKEKILRKQAKLGIELPEGRTPFEKALIEKVNTTVGKPLKKRTSDKMRQTKAAGLLTTLEGNTAAKKEEILRGLATSGLPLPEGKTASEVKLVKKVRADVGLPPEPKSVAEKEKYNIAMAAGIITPLEGKSKEQKENILKAQHDAGIPLPIGRTPSEKALIAEIKTLPKGAPPVRIPSEKSRKAAAAGLLTPLEGKSKKQREKIIRGLAMQDLPLPEGKTASEKKIIDKVRKDIGLPPEPRTASEKRLYEKALAAGIITPLEGKSAAEQEKALRAQQAMGIALPEGRTASEKALVAKVKATAKIPFPSGVSIPHEKLRKAKAAGLITPLGGKTHDQKEKILKGLAMHGIPLPEGKSASEKKLIEKVRNDLGLPPEAKAAAAKEKYNKAMAAGIITPLEGKTTAQKEKILKAQNDAGLPLPEGRTSSEKALIAKIKASPRTVPSEQIKIPSEKLRKAKAAGLLTPLKNKTLKQKEKILRGLAMQGLPLPEGKTASEKMIIEKVRADVGLPPEPKTSSDRKKYEKAIAAAIITPLEGKTLSQKEKVLKAQYNAGIPLPAGRTSAEKFIIKKIQMGPPALPPDKARELDQKTAKIMKEGKGPSDECICPLLTPESDRIDKAATISKVFKEPGRITSEKLRAAKAAGLLTPLQGKTPAQREKVLRGLVEHRLPLPEGKTASENTIVEKVRADFGLPPEPKTAAQKEKYNKAMAAGIITPLEGKTSAQKEKILHSQYEAGIPLPEGRTQSEKALISKIKASPVRIASEKLRKAAAAGLITPLQGKTKDQQEKIIRGLALQGLPLPEGKTASERKITDKVRKDVGLPPEPKTASEKRKYDKALAAGIITPLEGKSTAEKEKVLRAQQEMGISLPEGRTASEKAIVAKVKATAKIPFPSGVSIPHEKLRKAKAAGLITPLEGKTHNQKEKILKGLAMHGIPLPEGKSASEKKLIEKVRNDLGLSPEPKTTAAKEKYNKAMAAGIITPLEGKTSAQKEKILKAQHDAGLPMPEGRTSSENALITKIKASPRAVPSGLPIRIPSEKLRKAATAGLITPLEGKTKDQKEKIIRGLAMQGLPLPEGKTASERKIIDKVRKDIGLPPEPRTASEKRLYEKALAADIITPLEGKSVAEKEKVLRAQQAMGIALPEGRTASEKALVAKVKATAKIPFPSDISIPHEKLRKAKAAGLITPLQGKTHDQKKKILKGLAMHGIPLPEGKSASEKKLIEKVRNDLGLPPEAKTTAAKEKYNKAMAAGIITPLEGKTSAQKEKILKAQHDAGLPLPEGRTSSEKALIAKIEASPRAVPLKQIKIPLEKLRKAKAAGLLTPLDNKTLEQKEKILRGLAMQGLPLPEGKTASEKMIIEKVRADVGLPPQPKTSSDRKKYEKAIAAGIITPLEGKTLQQREKILKAQYNAGIPLPAGRTSSEKAIIQKIQIGPPALPPNKARELDQKTAIIMKEGKGPSDECICPLLTPESDRIDKAATISKVFKEPGRITSEKLRAAKAAGLLTPLQGKTPVQREKVLRGLVEHRLPLPEGKTASENKIVEKVRADFGLPPEPKTAAQKEKYNKAMAAGIITPLEGKTSAQKEKILQAQYDAGILLPEGRTQSEKALISKIKASPIRIASEKLRKAAAAGLITPLEGKTKDQQEKIIRGLALQGLPLPEAKTPSEQKLIEKVRRDLGLPPEPMSPAQRDQYNRAVAAGVIIPLEGKTAQQKEKILKAQHDAGIPLPEGRTSSEKALIAKITASPRAAPIAVIPSEKLRMAKAAGLITPLKGKTKEQKEKTLRGLAMHGIPFPEAKTASEKKIIVKVRKDIGLPPEPKNASDKRKYEKALAAGIITPLEGKSAEEKEKVLRAQHAMGIALPEGRTASEKALVAKVKATAKIPFPSGVSIPADKLRTAKTAGLITPLEGKTHDQIEKILKGLAMHGIPLPEAKSASEKKLIENVRNDLGLPLEAKTAAAKEKYNKAMAAGIITPLEGKTSDQKEQILRAQYDVGIPLPEGRTASEKALIKKIKATAKPPSVARIPSEKLRKAKVEGFLTPLKGKTTAQKEKIIRGLAQAGLPLPEGKTSSEKSMIRKMRAEFGIPPEAKTASEREIIRKAKIEGLLTPLKGKTQEHKEKIILGLAQAGLPIPEGTTVSEKELVRKIRTKIGLPPDQTPSEKKGKIKSKSKRVGVGARKSARGVGPIVRSTAGIVEDFEDILKTTTCDRGCGCNKKKIRFKHSYVKIRVTSPDISSLCPCPDECVPGVKHGVFTDNEGIKVTVGRVVGVPSYLMGVSRNKLSRECKRKSLLRTDSLNSIFHEMSDQEFLYFQSKKYDTNDKKLHYLLQCNRNFTSTSEDELSSCNEDDDKVYSHQELDATLKILEACVKHYKTNSCHSKSYMIPFSQLLHSTTTITSARSSYDSVVIIETESSLSLSTQSLSDVSMSIISVVGSGFSSNTSHYLLSEHDIYSDGSDFLIDNTSDTVSHKMDPLQQNLKELTKNKKNKYNDLNINGLNRSLLTLRLSQTKIPKEELRNTNHDSENKRTTNNPVLEINSHHSIIEVVNDLILKKSFSEDYSIVLLKPAPDESDNEQGAVDDVNSTPLQFTQNVCKWEKESTTNEDTVPLLPSTGVKITRRGKQIIQPKLTPSKTVFCEKDLQHGPENIFKLKETETYRHDKETKKHKKLKRFEEGLQPVTKNKKTLVNRDRTVLKEFKDQETIAVIPVKVYRAISVDTIRDRPCCCTPKESLKNTTVKDPTGVLKDFTAVPVSGYYVEDYNEYTTNNSRRPIPTEQRTFLTPNQETSIRICRVPPCRRMPPPIANAIEAPGTGHATCLPDMPNAMNCPPNAEPHTKTGEGVQISCPTCGHQVDENGVCKFRGEKKTKKERHKHRHHDKTHIPIEGEYVDAENNKYTKNDHSCKCAGGKKVNGPKCQCCTELYQSNCDKTKCCDYRVRPTVLSQSKTQFEVTKNEEHLLKDTIIMKSNTTQTLPGFKYKYKKRVTTPDTVELLSFEDALRYFEEHPEEIPEPIHEECICVDEETQS